MPYEEERPLVFSFASIKSYQSERHAGAAAGEHSPAAFFISRNGLRPRPDKPDNQGAVRRGWDKCENWSICRICGETLKQPPPFSSSERSTSEKKCNTVTTFGKRRKSER